MTHSTDALSEPAIPRILILSASPRGMDLLSVDAEMREIQGELDRSAMGRTFDVDYRPALRYEDLQHELLRAKPTVLHFSGHAEKPGIYVEGDGGEAHLVSAVALGELLATPVIRRSLRVVVLNACLTAEQAEAISRSIDGVVVGMSNEVTDEAAIEFARGLYGGLGDPGVSLQSAFMLARNRVMIAGFVSDDLAPQIFVREGFDAGAALIAPGAVERAGAGPVAQPATPTAPGTGPGSGIIHAPPAGWAPAARKTRWRYKVVALDLDGTLIRGDDFVFSWAAIWNELDFGPGIQGELKREYRQHSGATASRADRVAAYRRWCERACELFKTRGLTRSQLATISARLHLTANCREALTQLRAAGMTIAIVSGGVSTFLEDLFPDFRQFVDFAFINELTFADGGALEGVIATAYDFEGKADALDLVCQRVGCDPTTEAVFVGDHFNDEAVMLRAGLAIAYPPHDLITADASQAKFLEDDLLAILPRILVE